MRFDLFPALLDTGATASGIGPRVVDALSLQSYGKNRLGSATDEVFVDYYLFRIGLHPSDWQTDAGAAVDLPYLFDEVDGFSWKRQTDFDVIIGMDILSRCEVHLDRYGSGIVRFG